MIETGISFGNIHSFRDLDLILSDVVIPPASPKQTFVDIPGADGSVDLTEAHGEVKYSDRTGAKFTFYMNPAGDLSEDAWEAKKTEISNLLNGQRCDITLDKDPGYYWQGRCTVSDHASSKKLRKFVVGARLAPYKLKQDVTRVFVPLCGNNLFDSTNLPLVYGGYGCTLSALDSGVRITWEMGQWTSYVARFLPIQMLLGNTITLSGNLSAVGGVKPCIILGYVSADGSRLLQKVEIKETGSVALDIGEDAAAYDNLGIWLYANAGADPASVSEGAYADYTNVVIELGDTTEQRRNLLDVSAAYHFNMCAYDSDADVVNSKIVEGYYCSFYTYALNDILFNNRGQYFTFSLKNGTAGRCISVVISGTRSNESTYYEVNGNLGERSVSFEMPADFTEVKFVEFRFNRNTKESYTDTETVGSEFQFEKGAIATEYTPFVSFVPHSKDQAEIDVTITNARKTVCPSIIVTDEATVTFSGGEATLSEGTHKVLDLQLHEGETPVTVSGTGAVAFVYQEGDL